jgi:hypothetical protein
MKTDTVFLAALFLSGTNLLSRIATQGVEQALLSAAVEYGFRCVRWGARLLPQREGNPNRIIANAFTLNIVLMMLSFGAANVSAQTIEEQAAVMTPSAKSNRLERLSALPRNFKFSNSCDLLKTPHRQLLSANAEQAMMRHCGESVPSSERQAPLARASVGPQVAAPIANRRVNNPAADSLANQTTQSETTIAKDAVTGNLIVGWNDSGAFTGAPGNSFTGWGVSTNGGTSWTDMGPFPPLTANDWSLGDPSLANHNATGSTYFATLACAASTCNLEKLEVAKSTNGGLTFPQRVNPVPLGIWDKDLIAVDNTGGVRDGNVYLVATDFSDGQIKFVRSTNRGVTWSAPVALNAGHAGCDTGAFPFVGPDGTIYVTWQDFGCIGGQPGIEMTKSTDGGVTWSPFTTVSLASFAQDDSATAFCGRPALNGNVRITNFPQMGASPINSSRVYVTWNAKPSASDDADVFFSRSTNGGATWSAPIRLNDDSSASDQFMPALNVAADGTILVTWYDRREDSANLNMRPWGVLSFDDGASFTANFPIGDTLYPPAVNFDPVVASCYVGDYNWITHDAAGNFHLTWGDNRDTVGSRHDPDVFYATFPTTGPGAILALATTVFDDTTGGDGDDVPEPGETVNVTLTLKNSGRATATGVTATLSTTTEGVTLLQATSLYPDIPAGGSAADITPFSFSVDSAVKLGTETDFILDVTTATQGSFSLLFSVKLGTPPIVGFLYTNDDGSLNTVSGFSVSLDGKLTAIPGSPFSTGGTGKFGGFFAAPRIKVLPDAGLLYAANGGSNNVSGFTIALDGSLKPVPGSPFATGLSGPEGIAVNRTGTCLFVGAVGSGLAAFNINANGSLSFVEIQSTSDVVDGLRTTPDESLLIVSFPFSNQLGVFAIDSNCGLTPTLGSPFPAGSMAEITGLELNAAGDRLFGGIANFGSTAADEYDFVGGVPFAVPGSPFIFSGHGSNSNVVRLNPTEDKLFVPNQASSSVAVLDLAPDGSLTPIAGSPFPAPGALSPSGEAIAPDGKLLFVADSSNAIYIYDIASDGSLEMVDGSPFPTSARGTLLSLDFVPQLPDNLSSLRANKAGNGVGTVTSSPAGISCGSDCTENYAVGTIVTLTATPAPGFIFAKWSGGGCSGTGTCIVTMNADKTVTATFVTPLALAALTLPGAEAGVAYNAPLITGGLGPYNFTLITGVLPLGLNFNSSNGRLTGTPSPGKGGTFTVKITDQLGSSVTGSFKITIVGALNISTKSLKAGTHGKAYKGALKAAGGKTPYTWSLFSGSLPAGLTLNSSTGAITGIPTQTGSFNLIFRVTDPAGGVAQKALALTIK